jgi:uncharacterized protein
LALFALICTDKPDALDLRMATREAHLAYLATFGDRVKLAGPKLTEAGQPAGSILIVEADDLTAAKAFAAGDPYAQAGLFEAVDVTAFRAVIGKL